MQNLPHRQRLTRRTGVALMAVAALALGVASAPASAKINKEDFAKFIDCPVEHGAGLCTYGETLSGEFKMGSKSVPITNRVVLQGGLASAGFETYPLIPPRLGGEAMTKTSQPIPGGLTGLTELVGGPASATAEMAGPPERTEIAPFALAAGTKAPNEGVTAVTLFLKVHLENEQLGPNCYIGSDEEPIKLELTTGKTHGSEPLEGNPGKPIDLDKARIIELEGNTLVGDTFSVPAAKGCGTNTLLEPVITAAVNAAAGLPAASGNKAVLSGNFFTTFKQWAEKYAKAPKVKKTKK